jgi:multidrug efflux system membrane fusion protein
VRSQAAAVLATCLLVAGCGSQPVQLDPASSDPRFPVEVALGATRRFSQHVQAPGALEPFETQVISARVQGVIEHILVSEGDAVAAGQPIAEIEADRYRIAVDSSQAALHRAQAVRDDAVAAAARRDRLASSGAALVNEEELTQFRARAAQAEADVAAMQAALARAQLDLSQTTVRSPSAGIIQLRIAQTGQFAQPGTPIASQVQRDPLRLRFAVSPEQARDLPIRQRVDFHARGQDDSPHHATISFIAGQADAQSRLVGVIATVDGPSAGDLVPGSFAEVSADIGQATPSIVIPDSAVRPSERGFLVFVLEEKAGGAIVHERTVEIWQHTTDGGVAVRTGLSGTDRIVIHGAEALHDGASVRIVEGAGHGPETSRQ